MHHIIRILVKAKTKDAARYAAEQVLNKYIGTEGNNPLSIDYGTFFDDDKSTMSGKARWGKMPVAAKADSPKGAYLILVGFEEEYAEFEERYNTVKDMINAKPDSDKVFMDDDIRFRMRYAATSEWFLTDEGDTEPSTVDWYLLNELKDLWVVPCDVHT